MSEQETPPSHPDLSSFTVRAQRILAYAQEEAARFGQAYVSPEHLMLALLWEEDTLAVRVLRNRGVVPKTLHAEIEQRIEQGTERSTEPLPFTPRSLHVITLSQDEARRMYNRYIGTEHLLLGLMRERDSLAGRLLSRGAELIHSFHEGISTSELRLAT